MLHANMKRMTHPNNREFANAAPPYLTDRDMFRKFGLHLPRAKPGSSFSIAVSSSRNGIRFGQTNDRTVPAIRAV
jgi:hypothetical protein